ncbi:MAG: heparinase II/III family protein [Sedimentisphaeraceae bacterium JB056]
MMNFKLNRCVFFVFLILSVIVQASPEMSAEKLKELYDNNCKRKITDADFFGSFINGRWAKKPMVDYAYSSKLRRVEDAVKVGDYEQAGVELLEYFQNRPIDPKTKPRGGETLRVKLRKDKFFGFDQQITALDTFELKTQPEDYYISINRGILRREMMTFKLMGRHKDGVVSFVDSRNSENPPMLQLQFNDGLAVSVKAVEDAYVRAGKYSKINYGTEEKLEVCNSGLKVGKPFDDNTRWSLISFDLSKVDVKSVKSVKMKLKAFSTKEDQSLVLFWVKPTVFDEKEITWDNNLGYIYSWEGLPGGVDWDMPKGAHNQFPNWTQRLYWLYNMTAWSLSVEDRKAERVTLDLICDFMADLPSLDCRDADGNELNAAGRAYYYSMLFPHLFSMEACQPRDCVELLKGAVRNGSMLYINPSKNRGGNYGNQGMSKFSSLILLSVTFPEFADSKLWIEDANDRLKLNLKSMVLDDGAYIEHTFGYPYGVLDQMVSLLELYKEHDLKSPDALAPKTHQLARYLMFCSLPDGTPPNWGEGTAKSSVTSPAIKRAAIFFNDPELTWWVSKGKTGHAPEVTNISYPNAKIGILRNSWQPDANVLFLSSRVGGGHYHMDQNAVILSAYGQKLLNDTGMSSYESRHPHFDWQRHQTKSHNTVEVDERGYPRLKPKSYVDGPCGTSAFVSDNAGLLEGWGQGYPNVRHERKVFFLKEAGLYFVADMLKPNDGKSHTYDQCWHIYPNNTYETDAKTCRVWTTNSQDANLEIIPIYPKRLELLLRKGFNAVPLTDTTYPSYRQQTSGNAEFITILKPSRPGAYAKSLKSKLIESTDGSRAVRIATEEGTGLFIVSHGEGITIAGNVETDARCVYVQFDQDGKVKWASRAGGTIVKVAGREIPCEVMELLKSPELPK